MSRKQLIALCCVIVVGAGAVLLAIKATSLGHGDDDHDGNDRHHEGLEDTHPGPVSAGTDRGANEAHAEKTMHRIELSAEAARDSGIVLETVAPATITGTIRVNGRIVPNEERLKHVVPRYPGVLVDVRKRLGDHVRSDEVLAVVESNESLQTYEVRSGLAGTIIEKHATPGEFVREGDAIFVVADLTTVWVDLNIYRQDATRVREGQPVVVHGGEAMEKQEGVIEYISPFGAENTQTLLARVILPNPRGEWRPGLFVTAEVVLESVEVPLAVRSEAIQTLENRKVVFINEGNFYEPAFIEIGRQDGERVEVLSGLAAGQRYVASNSFIIKAEILKGGVGHVH